MSPVARLLLPLLLSLMLPAWAMAQVSISGNGIGPHMVQSYQDPAGDVATVANTSVETGIGSAVFTPSGTGVVRVKLVMSVTNNNLATTTLTVRFKLGLTTVVSRAFTVSDGATVVLGGPFRYVLEAEILITSTTTTTTYLTGFAEEVLGGVPTFVTISPVRITAAPTLPTNVATTVQWNVASGSATLTVDGVTITALVNN